MLNGKHSDQHVKDRKPNLAPYTSLQDDRIRKLLDVLVYLDEWEQEAESSTNQKQEKSAMMLSPQTRVGIEMTVRGFIGALTYLLKPVSEGGAGTN